MSVIQSLLHGQKNACITIVGFNVYNKVHIFIKRQKKRQIFIITFLKEPQLNHLKNFCATHVDTSKRSTLLFVRDLFHIRLRNCLSQFCRIRLIKRDEL